MFDDIQSEFEVFFDDLNWTYIFMFAIVLYGIKHKDEFIWYNNLFNAKNWGYFKSWVAGIIIAGFFILFRWLGEDDFNSEYITQMLRSWIITIIFSTAITNKINRVDESD